MLNLWRFAVSVVLGGLAGSTGYGVWQARDFSDAWAFALIGALAGGLLGILVMVAFYTARVRSETSEALGRRD